MKPMYYELGFTVEQETIECYEWQYDSSVKASGTDKFDVENESSKSRTFSIGETCWVKDSSEESLSVKELQNTHTTRKQTHFETIFGNICFSKQSCDLITIYSFSRNPSSSIGYMIGSLKVSILYN